MDWRLKCLAFHVLARVPFGNALHAILQRYVTGRYFQRLTPSAVTTYNYHVENFRKLPPGASALEFGAGRNLLTPLLLSQAGASRIYAYDLQRLATVAQVNDVIAQFAAMMPGQWPTITSLDELAPLYRIEYRAPGDARATGLEDGSIDFVYSSSTLEHIPPDDIRAILAECRRISSARAMMSFIIDYHDHYGTADPAITRWNFYRYTEAQWRKFNPGNHFQNRLRHCDHQRIFADLGFEFIIDDRIVPAWTIDELRRTPLSENFSRYSQADLLTANGHFLLRRAQCLQ